MEGTTQVIQGRLAPVRTAFLEVAATKYSGLPPVINTIPFGMRNAPLDASTYEQILAKAGAEGRAFRTLLGLMAPIEQLSLGTVSRAFVSNEVTAEDQEMFGYDFKPKGYATYAAFAEARSITVYDTANLGMEYSAPDKVFYDEQLERLDHVKSYYYLSQPEAFDVVLDGEHCGCCYDARYLDYLKAIFDLRQIGNALIYRIRQNIIGNGLAEIGQDWIDDRLLGWMNAAGFSLSVFLARETLGQRGNPIVQGKSLANSSELYAISGRNDDEVASVYDHYLQIPEERYASTYAGYMVFQRESFAAPENVRKILEEATEWELANLKARKTREDVSGSRSRIIEFQSSIPQLEVESPQAG